MAREDEKDKEDRTEELYAWISTIPFLKPKKNLTRDFSDAVRVAEVLKAFYPRYVELHNYVPASSVNARKENWNTLNRKVLAKIDMKLSKETIQQLANAQSGAAESFLLDLKRKVLKDSEQSEDTLSPGKDSSPFEEGKIEENNLQSVSEDNSSAISPLNNELIIGRPDSIPCTFVRAKQKILFALKWFINWFFIWNYLPDIRKLPVMNLFFTSEQEAEIVEPTTEQCEPGDLSKEDMVIQQMCSRAMQKLCEIEEVINSLNHKIGYLENATEPKELRVSN